MKPDTAKAQQAIVDKQHSLMNRLMTSLEVMAQHHINGTQPTLEERNEVFYLIAKVKGQAE